MSKRLNNNTILKKTKFKKCQALGESEVANIFISQQNHNLEISTARHLILTKGTREVNYNKIVNIMLNFRYELHVYPV